MRERNVSVVPWPKSPMLTPVMTISFPPWSATWRAWSTIDEMVPERERPRAMGMVQ